MPLCIFNRTEDVSYRGAPTCTSRPPRDGADDPRLPSRRRVRQETRRGAIHLRMAASVKPSCLRHLHSRLLIFVFMVSFSILIRDAGIAGETTLLSIGPRFGFTGQSPFLGQQQKHTFYLVDVAAVFALPWAWPLGSGVWRLETRVITSAGLLTWAGDAGLLVTGVPVLALSGWERFLSIDAGVGPALFSRDRFGIQDFGGPVQIMATIGVSVTPLARAYAGFRVQHFSDAGFYGPTGLGVDMYLLEAGYRF